VANSERQIAGSSTRYSNSLLAHSALTQRHQDSPQGLQSPQELPSSHG
jgi:hypothetical protein